MDMKRILQALDGAAAKPVEGASDMAKFMSVVNSANKPETLTEGANPHKVSLPVQMAMQHYQKPAPVKKSRPALIDKYFAQVQEEQLQEKKHKKQLINQYARTIAERVMMREGKEEWHTSPSGARTNMSPADDDYEINYGADGAAASMDHEDTVTLDIPLLIRLLEYAREDAKTDMDLHNVAEKLIDLGNDGKTLSMDDYNSIVGSEELSENADELDNYDVDGLQSYYSDFHKDLHGFRPRHHSEEEWNDPEVLKDAIRKLHKYMDMLKSSPEGRAQLKADGWHIDEGKKIKPKKSSSKCYANQTQVGVQTKDGNVVSKCSRKQAHKQS
jgi:hypothetical protein